MDILLLEDDLLVAELVELVLCNLEPKARVRQFSTLAAAKSAWQAGLHSTQIPLIICDRNLSDGSGLELVKLVRSQGHTLPIVMISAHSDRDAVVAAAHYGVSEFIAKPLHIPLLQQRLQPLLSRITGSLADIRPQLSPDNWLAQAWAETLRLPTALAPEAVLALLAQSTRLSPQELARHWQNEVQLSARLLNLANSASLKRSGQPITRLDDAISTLGIDLALGTAMASALDISGSLQDPRLKAQAEHYQTTAEQVASIARAMAISLGLSGASCYTAGLLSRAGELAVLRALQDFIQQGGKLSDEQIPQLLAKWGPDFGNQLKQQWGLPLPMRELIGAIHRAPTHATQRLLLLMHLAGLRVASRLHTPEALRMLRQSGLDAKKWLPQADEMRGTQAHHCAPEDFLPPPAVRS